MIQQFTFVSNNFFTSILTLTLYFKRTILHEKEMAGNLYSRKPNHMTTELEEDSRQSFEALDLDEHIPYLDVKSIFFVDDIKFVSDLVFSNKLNSSDTIFAKLVGLKIKVELHQNQLTHTHNGQTVVSDMPHPFLRKLAQIYGLGESNCKGRSWGALTANGKSFKKLKREAIREANRCDELILALRDTDHCVHTVAVKNVEKKLRFVVSHDPGTLPSSHVYHHPLVILEARKRSTVVPESINYWSRGLKN